MHAAMPDPFLERLSEVERAEAVVRGVELVTSPAAAPTGAAAAPASSTADVEAAVSAVLNQALHEAQEWAAGRTDALAPARSDELREASQLVVDFVRQRAAEVGRRRRRRDVLADSVALLIGTAPPEARRRLQLLQPRSIGSLIELIAMPLWTKRYPPAAVVRTADAAAVAALLDEVTQLVPETLLLDPQLATRVQSPHATAELDTPADFNVPPSAAEAAAGRASASPAHYTPWSKRRAAAGGSVSFAVDAAGQQAAREPLPRREWAGPGVVSVGVAGGGAAEAAKAIEDAVSADAAQLSMILEGHAHGRGRQPSKRGGGVRIGSDGNALTDAVVGGLRSASEAVEAMLDEVNVVISASIASSISSISSLGRDCAEVARQPVWVCVRMQPERLPLGRRSDRLASSNGTVRVRGAMPNASPALYGVDAVLEEGADQPTSYEHGAGTLVARLLAGRRCAMLFLGAPGAGKTHAAFGASSPLGRLRERADDGWGAAPRATRQVFDLLGEAAGPAGSIEVSVSWVEVRGRELIDLLRSRRHDADGGGGARRLRIRESPTAGPYVQGLSRVPVERHDQVLALLTEGARRRAVGAGRSSINSSLGTSFFTLHLRSRSAPLAEPPLVDEPRLTIVDVATAVEQPSARGAARLRPAGAAAAGGAFGAADSAHGHVAECIGLVHASQQPDRPAGALGSVALAARFRRHPVTWLLQPALVGECTTAALMACSVGQADIDETVEALRLAVVLRGVTTRVARTVPAGSGGPLAPTAHRRLYPLIQ